MHKFVMVFFIMPAILSYAQYLRDERKKAQEYVDRLNRTRNFRIRGEEYMGSCSFRRDWFEYEDEYLNNWDRG